MRLLTYTLPGVTINSCDVRSLTPYHAHTCSCSEKIGFAIVVGTTDGSSQGAASENIIDAAITDVTTFVQFSEDTSSLDGSLVLNNIALTNVGTAVGTSDGTSYVRSEVSGPYLL